MQIFVGGNVNRDGERARSREVVVSVETDGEARLVEKWNSGKE
jgi:hypothetical protein